MTRRILLACLLLLACGLGFTAWIVLQGESASTGAARESGPGDSPVPRAPSDSKSTLVAPDAASSVQVATPATQARARVAPSGSAAAEVLVEDESGAPIAGAEVLWMDNDGRSSMPGDKGPVLTDEGGRCVLPLSRAGAVHVHAAGFYHAKLKASGATSAPVVMQPAVRVTGRVLEAETLVPIARAQVRPRARGCSLCPPRTVETGALGEFAIDGFPLGQQVGLRASAPGYLTGKSQFEVRDPSATSMDLVLQLGAEVWLEFFDADTGTPVSGVRVEGAKKITSDELGQLRAADLVREGESDARLQAKREGYLPADLHLEPKHLNPTEAVRIPLARAQQFAGRVQDSAGDPIPGVSVQVWDRTDSEAEPFWRLAHQAALDEGPRKLKWKDLSRTESRTRADGQFLLAGLAPWTREVEFQISHSDFVDVNVRQRVNGGIQPSQSEWTLERITRASGTIRGRLSFNGAPTGGSVSWSGDTREGSAQVDESDGSSFVLEGVEPGRVELTPHTWGLSPGTWCSRVIGEWIVDVRAGETTTVDLDLSVPVTSISGRTRWSDGEPAPELRLFARDADCGVLHAVADDLGYWSFTIPSASGSWTIKARSDSKMLEHAGISPGATGVDFVFQRPARARLRVIDGPSGLPLTRFDLRWQRPGDSGSQKISRDDLGLPDPAGWFNLDLPHGRFDFAVSTRRKSSRLQPAVELGVDTATNPDLEFTLRRGQRLDLRLAKGVAPWPKDVEIYLLAEHERGALLWDEARGKAYDADLSVGQSARSSRRVKFSARKAKLTGLPPGRYEFVSFPDTVRVHPATVRARAGTEAILVRWERR